MKSIQVIAIACMMTGVFGQQTVTVTKMLADANPSYPGCFMVCPKERIPTTRTAITQTQRPESGGSGSVSGGSNSSRSSSSSSASGSSGSSTRNSSSGNSNAASANPSSNSSASTANPSAPSANPSAPSANPSASAPSGDKLVTLEQFKQAITGAGYPLPAKVDAKYNAVISQLSSKGDISTKREFAMFLAQILHESDGLVATEEYACKNNGCPGQYVSPQDNGKRYYGRGYIQLTWYANYAAASKALYGNDDLVKNPEKVANDESVAWATALWYWKANVHGVVSQGEFGKSTKAINGALECSGGANPKATKRFANYTSIMKAFGLTEAPIERGCYN